MQTRLQRSDQQALPAKVILREVGPRDGFQSLSKVLSTDDKLAVINALIAAGVKRMETTAFVSPQAVPQLRDAAAVMAQVPRGAMRHAALVPNLTGARAALAAGVDELVVVVSASDAHNQANVRRPVNESLQALRGICGAAHTAGVSVTGAVAVAFGCPYAGPVPLADLFEVVDAFCTHGADALMLADTVGMATPLDVTERVVAVTARIAGRELICHFHNNRGVAMANLLAALQAGVAVFDTAVGGIGGCPNVPRAAGNLASEDVVFMLDAMGIETGIDLVSMIGAARLLEKRAGVELPGQTMKSGAIPKRRCRAGSGGATVDEV
jgi:hydroxymethylglutaryl-CoA lyase